MRVPASTDIATQLNELSFPIDDAKIRTLMNLSSSFAIAIVVTAPALVPPPYRSG